jgi:hypothetical protein
VNESSKKASKSTAVPHGDQSHLEELTANEDGEHSKMLQQILDNHNHMIDYINIEVVQRMPTKKLELEAQTVKDTSNFEWNELKRRTTHLELEAQMAEANRV